MCGKGVCMAGGHVWLGRAYVAAGACMAGVCVWWGHAWQGSCMVWGMHGRGACMAGKTAIAVGGTHPTGMHSCCDCDCMEIIFLCSSKGPFTPTIIRTFAIAILLHDCDSIRKTGQESQSQSQK